MATVTICDVCGGQIPANAQRIKIIITPGPFPPLSEAAAVGELCSDSCASAWLERRGPAMGSVAHRASHEIALGETTGAPRVGGRG